MFEYFTNMPLVVCVPTKSSREIQHCDNYCLDIDLKPVYYIIQVLHDIILYENIIKCIFGILPESLASRLKCLVFDPRLEPGGINDKMQHT